ncbi:SGNH/GDSL hydrolase family protein [Portibacter lacus]|nr:SGNH/GDSL hydrolase family protein [Portibacter lacus]
MIKSLLFILLLTGCGGLMDNETEKEEEKESMEENASAVNYLALGDSYTIGESVGEKERFPYQLIHSELTEPHELGKYKIIAKTGWTTRDLLNAMDKENLVAGDYDFITLLIGVNNQYQGKDFELFKTEFNELMDRATSLLNGDASKVIVVSIPDYSVTPFAGNSNKDKIAREIKEYNDYKEKVAKERGAPYVYITDLTQNAASDLSLLAGDQLHPSGKSYGQWVERILPVLNNIVFE